MVAKDQEIERLTGLLAERDHALAALRTEAAVANQRADGERLRAERAEVEADRLRQERTDSEVVAPTPLPGQRRPRAIPRLARAALRSKSCRSR